MGMTLKGNSHARRVHLEIYVASLGGNLDKIDELIPPENFERGEQPVKVRMPSGQVVALGQENARKSILECGGVLVRE